jgi:hypothetical protein
VGEGQLTGHRALEVNDLNLLTGPLRPEALTYARCRWQGRAIAAVLTAGPLLAATCGVLSARLRARTAQRLTQASAQLVSFAGVQTRSSNTGNLLNAQAELAELELALAHARAKLARETLTRTPDAQTAARPPDACDALAQALSSMAEAWGPGAQPSAGRPAEAAITTLTATESSVRIGLAIPVTPAGLALLDATAKALANDTAWKTEPPVTSLVRGSKRVTIARARRTSGTESKGGAAL